METNWNSHGVLAKSLVESWTLKPAGEGGVAMASDGQYLYVHGPFGLCKVGSGYGNTKKVGSGRDPPQARAGKAFFLSS